MALSDRVDSLDIPGKLVPPENWHLTLRFLGEISETKYEVFLLWLRDIEEIGPFPIRLEGIGGFPRPELAAVVWVGLTTGSHRSLDQLNQVAEMAAQKAGLEPEDRPFRSHLTLSRVRPPQGIGHLMDEQIDLSWTGDRVVVYRSHLGDGPARYEEMEIFRLRGD